MLALSILGSATLLFSCDSKPKATVYDYETLLTESSENRTITMMENGKRSYSFSTPLMEGYSMASNPYQEFRRGITMTTYTDSLSLVDATINANYAIYYERQKLWEAKGNVVIIKNNRKEGDTTITGLTEIYTQQLFWNATTKKIYSNVDTKVLQPDGWHFGVGFDADEDLKNIHFRKYSSEMEFDMSQSEGSTEDNKEADKEADKGAGKEDDKAGNGSKGTQAGASSMTGSPRATSSRSRGASEPTFNTSPLPTVAPQRPSGNKGEREASPSVTPPSMGGRASTINPQSTATAVEPGRATMQVESAISTSNVERGATLQVDNSAK